MHRNANLELLIRLHLLQVDDGVGFDVSAVTNNYENRGSLGMINLRERTELVNGLLNFQSQPGQGTTVTLTLPTDPVAASGVATAGLDFSDAVLNTP